MLEWLKSHCNWADKSQPGDGLYSVSDRVTIDGVPFDRRSDSFVCNSGCDETMTFAGRDLLMIYEVAFAQYDPT